MQDEPVSLEEQFALLKKENAKLKMESSLRKSLANELEKQKVISEEARRAALSTAEELKSLSLNLSRYVSPQIYKKVFDDQGDVQLNSSRKKLTIFFSDIVGFTQITEELESEDLTDLLNEYLNAMATIAIRHGATIDKYIGDAIMIFFGDPESSGTSQDAKKELINNLKFKRDNLIDKLQLVSREEFNVLKKVIEKQQKQIEQLKKTKKAKKS